jgi:hypothetical protein
MKDHDALADQPFSYLETKDGRLQLFCRNKLASTLKGKQATSLPLRLQSSDAAQAQVLMARATGQFKFGNERVSKNRRNR